MLNTLYFLDILQVLVSNYNNTFHTAIGMTPNEVSHLNSELVWNYMNNKRACKQMRESN